MGPRASTERKEDQRELRGKMTLTVEYSVCVCVWGGGGGECQNNILHWVKAQPWTCFGVRVNDCVSLCVCACVYMYVCLWACVCLSARMGT